MALSKYVMVAGLVVMLVVGFAIGLFASPAIMPQKTEQPQTSASPEPTSTPQPASTDAVWDNIVATGKIRIGTDPSWPPFELLDNSSNIVGFEVDLADAIATKLGLTTEWHSVGFDTIIGSVQTKTLDLGVSGFSITAKRLNEVQFTMPHTLTRGQVIMLQSRWEALNMTTHNNTLTSLAELKTLGLTAGTQTGTTEQDELTTAEVNLRQFTDFGLAIQDMTSANPSVDCVYAETPITTAWINQYHAQGKTIVVIYDIPYYPCAFLANKDATTFVTKMNGAFAEMIASGQFDQIKAKWDI